MIPSALVCFLSYMSMASVGFLAHRLVRDKVMFLMVAKMNLMCGLVGMFNLTVYRQEHSEGLHALNFIEQICAINFLTYEISICKGIAFLCTFALLMPPIYDFIVKIFWPENRPITSISNFISLMYTFRIAFEKMDQNLFATSVFYAIPLIYEDKGWENRILKSGAFFFATQYFAELERKYF